jgi:hypothetical protein
MYLVELAPRRDEAVSEVLGTTPTEAVHHEV